MRQRFFSVFAAALIAGAGLAAQGAAPGQQPGTAQAPLVKTASVSGQVVDTDTGAPIGGALVRMQSRALAAAATPPGGRGAAGGATNPFLPPVPPGSDMVITDGDGRFVFHDLPKGATQLTATASGYLDRQTAGVPPRPLQLEDGQHLDGVKLRLLKVASITGVVLDEAGEPAVGLSVRAMRREVPSGIPRMTMSAMARTDDRGQYRLENLAPGQIYVLVPQTQTTVPANEADKSPTGLAMSAMNPLIEALTGGTQTSFTPAGVRIGDQMWRSDSLAFGGAGVAPPPPQNGRLAAYQTTFYPGVTQLSQAMPITVRSGEDRTGVDLQIRPTASARVSGTLMGPSGPSGATPVRLVPAPGSVDDDQLAVANATTAADGAFTFLGVPAGQYIVKATASPRGGPQLNIPAETLANLPPETLAMLQSRTGGGDSLFLQSPLAVGERDVTGLSFALRPGAKISGRVVFEGMGQKPAPQQMQNVQVAFAPLGGAASFGNSQTRLAADSTFKTGNYAPGTYTPSVVGMPGPWLLRSVTVAGRDVFTTGIDLGESDLSDLELTFTDRPSTVTGFVRQDANGPLPNATVLLIGGGYRDSLAAGTSPRQQTAIVQPTGAYTLGRLNAGDYYIVAVLDDAVPTDRDAAYFDAVARLGTRVTVTEGETRTVDLKIVRSIR